MKDQNKGVWIGVEDRNREPSVLEAAKKEFHNSPELNPLENEAVAENLSSNRRDFLKMLGFSLGAATVAAGCDAPIRKAIPYVVKPDTIVPGVATYYATSFVNGGDYCSILVKTREGRPIKIEGNSLSPITRGGTSARVQAAVLSLYDTNRLRSAGKIVDGKLEKMSWADLDKEVASKLNAGAQVRILTNTVLSPSAKSAIAEFQGKYPNTKVVSYDPVSSSALLQANEACFGERAIPNYRFEDAKVIVSFGADFLGTWISPVEYAAQYAKGRKVADKKKPEMSWHVQVESGMSLTGSNADNRVLVKPSEQAAAVAHLYNEVARLTGGTAVNAPSVNDKAAAALTKVAARLVENKGKGLVISAGNNLGEQILINKINDLLGNLGQTIDFVEASYQRQGDDPAVRDLIREMNAGEVDALFVWGANPVYDRPDGQEFKAGLEKVGLKVLFSGSLDETTSLCEYAAPSHHFLESWGDAEPKRGHFSLVQPTIAPLFETRQAEETLLRWAGSDKLNADAEQPYYEYLKAYWEGNIFPNQSKFASFQAFWDNALHDGVAHIPQAAREVSFAGDVNAAAQKINQPSSETMEAGFYETINMGAGQYADNPWLMEMPDPIHRCVWGNYLSIPVEWNSGKNKFEGLNKLNNHQSEADRADLSKGENSARFTIIPQFGQMEGTVAVGLGYGRTVAGRCGTGVGENMFPWLSIDADGHTQYFATGVNVSEKVETDTEYACVQYHHTMGVEGYDEETGEDINLDEKAVVNFLGFTGYQGSLTGRSIIYQGNVREIDELKHHIEERRAEAKKLNEHGLYPLEEYTEEFYSQGHHWNMYVDMTSCIGCGACTVACMAENNVPVVGKREVHRHHEMTWLRIDRYLLRRLLRILMWSISR
jgi:MoCo/4Fe-4S cofactor protein with predicted Tat translocation signal